LKNDQKHARESKLALSAQTEEPIMFKYIPLTSGSKHMIRVNKNQIIRSSDNGMKIIEN